MCQIVQKVWVGEWPEKTEYLVLKNGPCACIRPIDHLKCSKATQSGPSLLAPSSHPSLSVTSGVVDSGCGEQTS